MIGGEFALYYFFATFINELADCMFVVPTTTREGWCCKSWAMEALSADFNLNVLKNTYDYSCF